MVINIVAGSPLFNNNLFKKYPSDLTIGVDFGAYRLISHHQAVDIAFGDFDSISTDQFVKVLNNCPQVLKYDAEKDKTDTELALIHAIGLNPEVINLFGVTGKRIDHFLSVLNLFPLTLNHNIKLQIIDPHNKLYVLQPGTHEIKKTNYHYISFFNYKEEVIDLTLRGVKYELTNHRLSNFDSLCVSNEFKEDEIVVSFKEGNLLIVESND